MSLALVCVPLCQTGANQITDVPSASIKNASSVVAKDMLTYYHGANPGNVPGLFGSSSDSYYWWEAAAVWGSLIDYWNYTGDTQYVSLVQQALLWQMGPDKDYMTPNQTKTEVYPPSLPMTRGKRLTARVHTGKR